MVSEFRFYLNISRQKYLRYYAGSVNSVQVHSENGVLIRFPVSVLKPWVTHQGVHGFFLIKLDDNNKLIEIHKIE